MKTRWPTSIPSVLLALALVCAAGALQGCRGDRSSKPPRQFFPGMDDSPKWKNQGQSEFFADGRQLRPPPDHVVAFGAASFDPERFEGEEWAAHWLEQRDRMLPESDAYYRGIGEDGEYLPRIPESVEVNREVLERGQDRYNIYCAVCHGVYGDGQGPAGVRWSIPVANLHDQKFKDPELDPAADQWRDGYIFHTILNGVGDSPDALRMPAYRYALEERDAWAIVAYVRALQETGLTTPAPAMPAADGGMAPEDDQGTTGGGS